VFLDICASEAANAFVDNLARFAHHHLSRHGALAAAARALQVDPAKLRRYASRRGSLRELRDVSFLFELFFVMGFDPATVFSAAQRSSSLITMLALAEGSLEHALSPEFQPFSIIPGRRRGGARGSADRSAGDDHDLQSEVA
jgi:hypothetical protein